MDILAQRSRQETQVIDGIDAWLKSHPDQPRVAVISLAMLGMPRLRAHPGGLAGETLIRNIHARIQQVLRPGDHCELLSDGECLISLYGIKNVGHAQLAVRRLLHELNNYSDEAGYRVHTGPRLGIALFPDNASNAPTLVHKAGLALDMAKAADQEFLFYSQGHGQEKLFNWNIDQELERALRDDELQLHYQPQLSLANQEVSGVEALLRWQHPEHGHISPADFIPLAERSRIIHPLTRWCLHTCLRQLGEWASLDRHRNMSVNISSYNLSDPGFAEMVGNALQLWHVPAPRLTLEITEGALLEDLDYATGVLGSLRRLGVRISIDDFGTGYSSLSYLKHLPVDELKIDQSFVRNILNDRHDRSIVETIIKIARDFNFSLVAEGIEQEAALLLLDEMGCHTGQGYAIARPLPHSALMNWLENPPALKQHHA
ncbi:MAG: GGDEF domain-containing phosphodiesterase [Chromatiales bacterium]|nr:GGDEF domain-containing protein [Gammaproteobacteria bacterium]MBW6477284.1 GGDEF domain-containing phosphodiesterase [Chromatiales bacterium]